VNRLYQTMPDQAKALADAVDAALDPEGLAPALELILHAGDDAPVLDVPSLNITFEDGEEAQDALRLILARVATRRR